MASSSSSIPSAPIFVGENYYFCCIRMKALLSALDLWNLIEQGCILPEFREEKQLTADQQRVVKEKMTKDAKATAYLNFAIAEKIFPRIVNASSTKQVLDTLQEEFQDSQKMKIYGDFISDDRIVNKTLFSIDNKFNFVVTAIEESIDLDNLSPQELFGSLQAHEQKVSTKNEGSSEGAFQVKYKQHKSQIFKHNKNNPMFKDKTNDKKGKLPPCGICKKTNHLEKNCWNKEQKDCWFKEQQAKANVSETENFEDYLFAACQTKGKGTIVVQTMKGIRYIKNVLFVPNIASNLLSVPQMIKNGYSITFKGNSCNIYD
ncbi:hypothetical protein RND81_12G064800 [Saponaria officinalis]|uniref:Retrovirus-related Pol polyprotein from transposon TNT 1-94-like beta-barrel domain-containing protein n=1 Tax=Saponaria officinalis TaxID=3572 RepID=A0AAW1H5Z7_SAPOF